MTSVITFRSTVVVTNWEDHGSTMEEKYAAFYNLLSHGWDDHVSTTNDDYAPFLRPVFTRLHSVGDRHETW